MRLRAGLALVLGAVAVLLSPGRCLAQPWPALELTGTPSQWAQVTNWNAVRIERVRLLRDLALLFHSTGVGANSDLDRLAEWVHVLDAVERRRGSVQAPVADWRQLRGADRRALADLLDATGYEIAGGSKTPSIKAAAGPKAEALRALVQSAGFSLNAFIRDLEQSKPARLERSTFTVPLPLGAEYWRTRILGEPLSNTDLALRILQNRRLSLLYVGLFCLDRESLAALAGESTFVPRMSIERASVFAVFARSLRVRGHRLVTPGGAPYVAFWQDLVGASVDDPVQFADRLLGRDSGRLAWFFDFLQRAEPAVQAFALSSWETDARERGRRARALYDAMWDAAEVEHFAFTERPFTRPAFDPTLVLSLTATAADGRPASASSNRFWRRVFESDALPVTTTPPYRPESPDDLLDAPALVRLVADLTRPNTERESEQRASAFLLAQSYALREPGAPAAAVASIARASLRYPALVRTLDRLGATTATTVRAIERAVALSRLSTDRFHLATGQFQTALALIERLSLAGGITPQQAETLTAALLDVPLDQDDRFAGGVVQWMATTVVPLAGRQADVPDCGTSCSSELRLLALMTGRVKGRDVAAFDWDGFKYQVDLPVIRFTQAARARSDGTAITVDAALELASIAGAIGHIDGAATAKAAAARLRAAAGHLPTAPREIPLGDQPAASVDLVGAARTIEQIRSAKNLDGRERASKAVGRALDWIGLETLRALVYLPHAAGPRGGVSGAVDLARRHDFGSRNPNKQTRDVVAWAIPRARAGLGVQWHVEGAFVGFDQAAASLVMLEPLDGPPTPGQFDVHDRTVLIQSASAYSHDRPPSAVMFHAIGERLAQARPRLAGSHAPPELRSDWSPAAHDWALANEPDAAASLFHLSDLLTVGDTRVPGLDSIGTQFDRVTGTLRTMVPPQIMEDEIPGYVGRGYYAAGTLDLKVRIAELMDQKGIPAALFPTVSARAANKVLTEASPGAAFDWPTLRRRMVDFSAEDLAAVIGTLASDGTLVVVP